MDGPTHQKNQMPSGKAYLSRQLAWGAWMIVAFLLVATGLNHLHLEEIHRTCQNLNKNWNERTCLAQISFQIAACQEWEGKIQRLSDEAERAEAVNAWIGASQTLLDILTEKTSSHPLGISPQPWPTWKKLAQEYVDGVRWELDRSEPFSLSRKEEKASPGPSVSGYRALDVLRRAVESKRNQAQADGQFLLSRLGFLLARHTRWTAAWTVVAMSCVAIASLWMGGYVLRRVRLLAEAAGRLAEGKPPLRLPTSSQDELGQLARRLTQLAEHKVSSSEAGKEDRSQGLHLRQQWSQWIVRHARRILEPLEKIQAHSEMLFHTSSLPAEHLQAVRAIERYALLLRTLAENCDLWARLESNAVRPEPKSFSLHPVLAELVHTIQPVAEGKGVSVQLQWENGPERFVSDPVWLQKIVLHLLAWTVEKTELGCVQLRVQRVPDRDPPWVQLELIAPDKGMASEGLVLEADSFSESSQADGPPPETISWLVSRKLINLLGGKLKIETSAESGTTFILTLPMLSESASALPPSLGLLPEKPAVSAQSPVPKKLQGRVLLAEDGPENQRLIRFILQKGGLQVDVVADGQEAVQRVLQSMKAEAHQPPYDLILMDMLMPKMDGFQATRRLRQAGYQGPILAITGLTEKYSTSQCLEAGCTDYLAKPFEHRQLIALLAKYLPSPVGPSGNPPESSAPEVLVPS